MDKILEGIAGELLEEPLRRCEKALEPSADGSLAQSQDPGDLVGVAAQGGKLEHPERQFAPVPQPGEELILAVHFPFMVTGGKAFGEIVRVRAGIRDSRYPRAVQGPPVAGREEVAPGIPDAIRGMEPQTFERLRHDALDFGVGETESLADDCREPVLDEPPEPLTGRKVTMDHAIVERRQLRLPHLGP